MKRRFIKSRGSAGSLNIRVRVTRILEVDPKAQYAFAMKVLAEADPAELIIVGAPVDEYRPEAKRIWRRLTRRRKVDIEVTLDIVYEAFVGWLGGKKAAGPRESYRPIAKRLLVHLRACRS